MTDQHKCVPENEQDSPDGFYSKLMIGSEFTFQCPVLKGSVVEAIVEKGNADYLFRTPLNSNEIISQNEHRVSTQNQCRREIHFSQEFPPELHVELRLAGWKGSDFALLHVAYFNLTTP